MLLANHKNGTFQRWTQRRCGITPRTADRMRAAFQAFGGKKYRDTVSQYFDVSACYLLSAESCPEDVTQAALKRAEEGDFVSKKIAEAMIRDSVESDAADDDDGVENDVDGDTGDEAGGVEDKDEELVEEFDFEAAKKRIAAVLRQVIKACPPDQLGALYA